MPSLNFKKQFAPMVESGIKHQTIRAKRKDGRDPKVGQTLYLYTGLRTKSARKIGEVGCKDIKPITITENDVIIEDRILSYFQCLNLARANGFEHLEDFFAFFKKEHNLPFYGVLIKW